MLILAIIVMIISLVAFGFLPTLLIGGASIIGYREMYGSGSGGK